MFQNEKHGLSFNPGNLEQLEKSLTELIKNERKKSTMGFCNRKNVLDNFSVNKITTDFKIIIMETMNS